MLLFLIERFSHCRPTTHLKKHSVFVHVRYSKTKVYLDFFGSALLEIRILWDGQRSVLFILSQKDAFRARWQIFATILLWLVLLLPIIHFISSTNWTVPRGFHRIGMLLSCWHQKLKEKKRIKSSTH